MGFTRSYIKATEAELAIIKPILDTIGASPQSKEVLLGRGLRQFEMLKLGPEYYIYTDGSSTSVGTHEGGMHSTVRWPEVLMVFFADPKWTKRQFKKFGYCLAY